MTVFDPIAALKALITAGYVYGTVNTAVGEIPLDAIILVKTKFEERSSSVSYGNGILIIDSVKGVPSQPHHESYRNENWVMMCRIIYKIDVLDEIEVTWDETEVLEAIWDEIDRTMNLNNKDTSKDRYLWEEALDTDQFKNVLHIMIKIERAWVKVDI